MVDIPISELRKVKVDYAGKILTAEELRGVVEEVNRRAESDFYGVRVLNAPVKINDDGELAIVPIDGTILVNDVVRRNFPGVYVSTRAEKEKALREGLEHEGVYSYDSLCVGGVDFSGNRLGGRELDFDCRLAKIIGNDLNDLGKRVKDTPALVQMANLGLEPDKNYGFHYSVDFNASVIFDGRLKQEGMFNECDFERGLPVFKDCGVRSSYPNQGKLQGVSLDGGLGLVADGVGWSLAYCDSRVVLTDTREASRA